MKSALLASSPGHRVGTGIVGIRHVAGQSAVVTARSNHPLKLLTPQARGLSAWVCTSSFGGGLVSGDETRLEISVEADARGYVSTQASTKVYRNPRGARCGHQTEAWVGPRGLLVFTPDPVQPFADSSFSQRQEFFLAADASLVLLDWYTAGRTARGERWQFRRFASRSAVWQTPTGERPSAGEGSTLCFLDAVALDAGRGVVAGAHRTGRFECFATLLCWGPMVAELSAGIVAETRSQPVEPGAALVAAASPVRDGVVLRLAATEVELAGAELRRCLRPLISLLGDDPWARKW